MLAPFLPPSPYLLAHGEGGHVAEGDGRGDGGKVPGQLRVVGEEADAQPLTHVAEQHGGRGGGAAELVGGREVVQGGGEMGREENRRPSCSGELGGPQLAEQLRLVRF